MSTKGDFLSQFLGNISRAQMLRAFIFSPAEAFTLARAAKRAGVSMTLAEKEIKALQKLGAVKEGKVVITLASNPKRTVKGKQRERTWILNQNFKHARALSSFVHEVSPVQYKSMLELLRRSGRLSIVILSGVFMGDPTRPADLVVVGDSLSEARLEEIIKRLEPQFGREIRYATFSSPEFEYRMTIQDRLIRDTIEYPHFVLLDRFGLL